MGSFTNGLECCCGELVPDYSLVFQVMSVTKKLTQMLAALEPPNCACHDLRLEVKQTCERHSARKERALVSAPSKSVELVEKQPFYWWV